ncbi:MAG TPA: nuclear transport factor 2 family protein [Acidimicrobiia bacterium]|nr:nuclear transport factor 2 family protein [Acidimicrobiia bacterium]HKN89540.1 nuclear transport factor 2 family protein [Acidimicrobiia bacterium]
MTEQSHRATVAAMTTTPTTITVLSEAEADSFVAEWMEAWNSQDLNRILDHYADDVEYFSPFIAQLAEPGGPGADGRLAGKEAVRAYFAAALARNTDLHFDPPVHVAVGSGSVSFVYTSIRNLTAVETLVFAPGSRIVARAHCHYRAPAS